VHSYNTLGSKKKLAFEHAEDLRVVLQCVAQRRLCAVVASCVLASWGRVQVRGRDVGHSAVHCSVRMALNAAAVWTGGAISRACDFSCSIKRAAPCTGTT
jgi:hypothetical protein